MLVPRHDKPNKAQESWESRKASVVETIDSNFDLVGLQEVSSWPPHGQASYLVENLEPLGWTGYYPWAHKLFADEYSERIPIFWRPELFTLLDSGQFLLSGWNQAELALVPILEARYASFVKLQTADGSILWFYTLHLQHETTAASPIEAKYARAKREEGQQVLAKHIQRHRAPGETAIVAGDFNASEVSPVLSELVGLEDIAQRARSVENWRFNSFHDWRHPEDSEHIDHVLISGPGEVSEAAIVLSNASDHHPVQAIVGL